MKQNKGVFTYIIFFGALWGILEATLGYLLQFLPPLVSGSVMFPIAATLMILTYNHTKSKSAMIYVAMIAATIKSVNFFMPGLLPIKTYNPMISIMLQSLVMVLIIPLFQKKNVFYPCWISCYRLFLETAISRKYSNQSCTDWVSICSASKFIQHDSICFLVWNY
jgi:xanthine/uracil permease